VVQGWLQAVLCLPLRAWVVVEPAVASSDDALREEAAAVVETLHQRLARAALAGVRPLVPASLEPVLCRVVDRAGRGAAGQPSELFLDRSEDELRDAAGGFVTFGSRLLGFVAAPGGDVEAARPRPARVELLHAQGSRGARRVAAAVDTPAGALQFVVEPASRIDPWPLRCGLFERPYLASRLRHSGLPVLTAALDVDPLGRVPPGLRLGDLQVWGYPDDPDGAPIGLFVRPDLDPRAISVVVVWRPRRAAAPPALDPVPVARPVRVARLRLPAPPPQDERWVLAVPGGQRLPVGGALVRGHMVLGSVEQSGPGFAMASPFGGSRRLWSLWLLPDAARRAPIPLLARSIGGSRDDVFLRIEGDPLGPDARGVLFTGANGPHCPGGLVIGRAWRVGVDGTDLEVRPARTETGALAVFVGEEVVER
jgi:hypothetical protein